jgi:hypothetical protein
MGSPNEPTRPSLDEATEPSISLADLPADDATSPGFRDESTSPMGIREEPTAPAATRTNRVLAPWLSAPDPAPREMRPRDPLFFPVLVFVAVLVVSIGFVLFAQPRRHAVPPADFATSP